MPNCCALEVTPGLPVLWNLERARSGELEAIDRALKIAHRRAALLGLDRPTKIAPTTPDGDGPNEGGVLAALLQLHRQGRGTPAPEAASCRVASITSAMPCSRAISASEG